MYEPEAGEKGCEAMSSGHGMAITFQNPPLLSWSTQDWACYSLITHEEGTHKVPLLRDHGQIIGPRGEGVLFFSGVANDTLPVF